MTGILVGTFLVATAVMAAWFVVRAVLISKRNAAGQARRGALFQVMPGMELVLSDKEKKTRTEAMLRTFLSYVSDWQERMMGIEECYSLEVHASGGGRGALSAGGYSIFVWVPQEVAQHVPSRLEGIYEYPLARTDKEDPMSVFHTRFADPKTGYARNPGFYTAEFRLAAPYYMPIREWVPGTDPDDPMEQIYSIFDGLHGNNVAGYILTMKPADSDWRKGPMAFIDSVKYGIKPNETAGDRLRNIGSSDSDAPKKRSLDAFQEDDLKAVMAKAKQDAFEVVVRIYSTDWTAFEMLRDALERRYKGIREGNSLRLTNPRVSLADMHARWFDRSDMVLSFGEISTLFHLPDSATKASRLKRGASRTAMPPEGLPTVDTGSRTDIFTLMNRIGVEKPRKS